MKRSLCILLCCVCFFAGCKTNTVTPTPVPAVSAAPSLTPEAALTPPQAPAMAVGELPNFEEGKKVEQSEVPQVAQAVKAQYPDATITGVTYATHENRQVYHVMLSGADVSEVYVDAAGTLTPYAPGVAEPPIAGAPQASPDVSPSPAS